MRSELLRPFEGTYHLMGIGGAGVSGLALLLKGWGFEVSGCDVSAEDGYADAVRRRGIRVYSGHSPEHLALEGCDRVIFSKAVDRSNEELVAALRMGLFVESRSSFLGRVFNAMRSIGVSGTHGKTTTTSMVAFALGHLGLDLTALVGGEVSGWGSNVLLGNSDLLVCEVDESDRQMAEYSPYVSVLTNLELDHADVYGDVGQIYEVFLSYVVNSKRDGALVYWGEDPLLSRLAGEVSRLRPDLRLLDYALGSRSALGAVGIRQEGKSASFTLLEDGSPVGEVRLGVPGEHNVLNALAAMAVVKAMGLPLSGALSSLEGFRGAKRRLTVIGEASDVVFVDDYAHHPTEIKRTLAAARSVWPGRRVVVLFQPHRFSRFARFAADFAEVLAEASDLLFVLPVFAASEPRPEDFGSKMEVFFRVLYGRKGARDIILLDGVDCDARGVTGLLMPGDLVVSLGAGDVNVLLRRVFEDWCRLKEV